MPDSIDPLFIARKYWGNNLVFKYLVPRGKAETIWAKKVLPSRSLVFYDLNNPKASMATLDLAGVVKKTNVIKTIKKASISHLLPGHVVVGSLDKWANKNKIKLVAPAFTLVKKLENKLWFDNFLSKNNFPKPASQIWVNTNRRIFLKGKLVLQDPVSGGGEGTYFISQPAELKKLLKAKKIKKNRKYLLRQFINGIPYGITIYIGRDKVALSSFRAQCYGQLDKNSQKEFFGVQWVKSSKFSQKFKKTANQLFYNLAEKIRQEGYVGYANIDFIVKDSQIYILECNPRFSSSTVQLLLFAETISNINTAKLYLEDLLIKTVNKKLKFFAIPSSNFNGANFYLSTNNDRQVIKNYYPNGVYKFVNNKIKFVEPDINRLGVFGKSFIFYSDTQPGEVLSKGIAIGWIISNFPLYNSGGQFNFYSKMIIKHFRY